MAKCKTCGAPVNLAPDGDPKFDPRTYEVALARKDQLVEGNMARARDLERALERLYEQRNNGRLADHLEYEYDQLMRESSE